MKLQTECLSTNARILYDLLADGYVVPVVVFSAHYNQDEIASIKKTTFGGETFIVIQNRGTEYDRLPEKKDDPNNPYFTGATSEYEAFVNFFTTNNIRFFGK